MSKLLTVLIISLFSVLATAEVRNETLKGTYYLFKGTMIDTTAPQLMHVTVNPDSRICFEVAAPFDLCFFQLTNSHGMPDGISWSIHPRRLGVGGFAPAPERDDTVFVCERRLLKSIRDLKGCSFTMKNYRAAYPTFWGTFQMSGDWSLDFGEQITNTANVGPLLGKPGKALFIYPYD